MDRTINTSGRHYFETGQMIVNNSFRIDKFLGNGAFGEVYLATQLPLNVQRAIKVIRKAEPGLGSTEFEHYRDRFTLEARLGATFFHPNIIHVENFIEEQDRLLLVMNYAPGGSLANKITESQRDGQPIPIDQVVKWVREAALGLAKLHERDLVHRDIKPSNILINTDGEACIADLGLVQLTTSRLDGSSGGMNHPGTPEYMPPEQLPGNYMPLRASADVYALGCVLFELLTGRQYYHQHEGTPVSTLRTDTPDWLEKVVAKALSPDPKNRYFNAGKFADCLKEAETPPSPPLGVEEPVREETSPLKRSPLPFLFGGAVVIGLITLIILLSKNNPQGTAIAPSSSAVVTTITSNGLQITSAETESSEPAAGSTERSEIDGMQLHYIPAGTFEMGSPNGEGNEDEHPQHSVYLDAFWIDETEVTNQMYEMCVAAGSCKAPSSTRSYFRKSYYGDPEFANYPVIFVDWTEAKTYCEWAGRQLPTEAQWEKAARGTDSRTYPWGNNVLEGDYANFADANTSFDVSTTSINDGYKDTAPVGSYPLGDSPYGVKDMAGNVWEWVGDYYKSNYYQLSPSANPTGPEKGPLRVLRGGSFGEDQNSLTTTHRFSRSYDLRDDFIGFRCVLNIGE